MSRRGVMDEEEDVGDDDSIIARCTAISRNASKSLVNPAKRAACLWRAAAAVGANEVKASWSDLQRKKGGVSE